MSRNFDLMQEMESERDILLGTRGSSTFAGHDASRRVALTHRFTADAALSLVQRIFLRQTQPRPQLVVFAGVDHGNGCSEMAASVAESLAQNAPGAVCLVEANFRSPALATLFGTTNHHGLTEALLRETPIRQFIQPVCGDRMWLLSSGSLALNSAHLLISARLRERFTELRSAFDFVIVDAPPMTRYADAIVLGKSADGVVLVVEAEATRKEAARTAVDNLRSSDIPILGAVLNKRTFPIPAQIYKRL